MGKFALEEFKAKEVILSLDRFEAALFADAGKQAGDHAILRWGYQQLRTVKWNYEKRTFEFGGVLPAVAQSGMFIQKVSVSALSRCVPLSLPTLAQSDFQCAYPSICCSPAMMYAKSTLC